jgi:uncharacterized SAM-binding protein YcdF (DUF218 family)
MYFILSKILLFLLLPAYWIMAFLIVAVLNKKPKTKRLFLTGAVITLYFFTAPVFLKTMERVWDIKPYPANNTHKYSCVIVLGGFSSSGGPEGGHFNNAADRFVQGLKLMCTKQVSHILISGGNGQLLPGGFREATWVKTQLIKFNIPDSSILIESNSKNTVENGLFSKALLAKKHLPPPYLLVTSAFHMRRSLMIFKHAGMDVVPYPCNYFNTTYGFGIIDFLPDSSALCNWEFYTKEVIGYLVNYFK